MIEQPDIFLIPAQFLTIQAAVDAIQRPATIIVYPDAYDESVIVKNKESVVIQSARLSRRGVTITGAQPGGVFIVEQSTLHLSGIEIRSNGGLRGISVDRSAVTLQECVIAGNRVFPGGDTGGTCAAGAGMYCRGSSVRVQKSAIIGNTIDYSNGNGGQADEARGGGLYFEDCKIEIAGCTIQSNAVYSDGRARGGGIWCERGRMRMWRSRVTDNSLRAPVCEGAGIYFKDLLAVQVGGSVISGNGSAEGRGGGIFIEGDRGKVSVHRNTSVHLNHPDDIYPGSNSPLR